MKTNIKTFQDLKVWQDAHAVTLEIYRITESFTKKEIFGLTSQMRRAAASIGANIAEGFGRYHYKDKIKFYLQARGSLVELQNHILLAKDLDYLSQENESKFFNLTNEIMMELNGLIRKTGPQISNNL